jgi:hypothetical protein
MGSNTSPGSPMESGNIIPSAPCCFIWPSCRSHTCR